jgi:hypothetical protein
LFLIPIIITAYFLIRTVITLYKISANTKK